MSKEIIQAMSNPELRTMLFGEPGQGNFPVELQLSCLGLSIEELQRLRGKRVLDIGCGKGELVYFLNDVGIDAEGIDSRAPEDRVFIRQKVTGIAPMPGSIPRDNSSYDLVIAHSNPILEYAFTSYKDIIRAGKARGVGFGSDVDVDLREASVNGTFFMLEALRVMTPRGRFVCYPGLNKLEETLGYTLNREGFVYEHKPVGVYGDFWKAHEKDFQEAFGFENNNTSFMQHRTEIRRK